MNKHKNLAGHWTFFRGQMFFYTRAQARVGRVYAHAWGGKDNKIASSWMVLGRHIDRADGRHNDRAYVGAN